ncbi:MAG: DUF1816 domain-containing protein [Cyanobacteria bacterium SID2]|nr:DUF1816 domain-containing protein [Cyanobacteria bacterium SID2]MBP0002165.1 DUF1816 domain-containing protein [Cyanobacteria bacterium SBC]
MKELLLNVLQLFGMAWWVKIDTETPQCTYYFGPFTSEEEAEAAKAGYVEDLEQEGAQGIAISIERCKPSNLTVFDEAADIVQTTPSPILSGQT